MKSVVYEHIHVLFSLLPSLGRTKWLLYAMLVPPRFFMKAFLSNLHVLYWVPGPGKLTLQALHKVPSPLTMMDLTAGFLDVSSSICHPSSIGVCGMFWLIHLREREVALSSGQTVLLSPLLRLPHAGIKYPAWWIPSREPNGERCNSAFSLPAPPPRLLPYLLFLLFQSPDQTLEKGHLDTCVPPLLASPFSYYIPQPLTPNYSPCPHSLTGWKGLLFHSKLYSLYVTWFSFTTQHHIWVLRQVEMGGRSTYT